MLEQLLVGLEYPHTANCIKCHKILFEIRLIDQFIRTKKNKKEQGASSEDAAKFYLLHTGILPSSLIADKTPTLCQEKPFFMQFIGEIKCKSCEQKLGIKMLTVSSDFHLPQFLGRSFIYVNKVTINTQHEDVTSQITQRFSEKWDDQTQLDDMDVSQDCKIDRQQIKNKQVKKQKIEQKKPQLPKQQLNEHPQLKYLRRQLEKQAEQNRQAIHQIVGSIDFFNDVLTRLEKRMAQTENVCNVLKQKVEKIIPLLRKKNEQ